MGYNQSAGSLPLGPPSSIPYQHSNQAWGYPSSNTFPQTQYSQQSMPQPPAPAYNSLNSAPTFNFNLLPLLQSTPAPYSGTMSSAFDQRCFYSTPVPQSQVLSSYHSAQPPSQATPPLQSGDSSSYYGSSPPGQSTPPSQSGLLNENSYVASPSPGRLSRQDTYAGYSNTSSTPQPELLRILTTPTNWPNDWGNGSPPPSQRGSYPGNGAY